MKKLVSSLFVMALFFVMVNNVGAFFIDFEDGVEGNPINDIMGVSFLNFNGYDALYGDSRTGLYNTSSDDLGYGTGAYHHNGNMWLWAGPTADARGVIVDFTNNDGTWFTTGYSAASAFTVDAYLTDGSMVSTIGASNLYSPMGFLTVTATAGLSIDYLVLHDTGNQWLVDDMSGDASGVNPVPEPSTILLVGTGLLGIIGFGRKRLNKKA